MKKLKKLAVAALVVTMAISMAACGSSSSNSSSSSGSAASASTESVKGQTFKAALEPTFPPFDTTDDQGNLAGLDVDLVNAIAEDQGFTVEWENLQFDGLIPALQSGNVDIVASGMSINSDREKEVDFSDPYYDSGLVVAVKADNTTINGEKDLTPDMKVAAQIGTTGAQEAQKLKDEGKVADVVILPQLDTAMMQLINGDVQAVINDKPVTEAYIAKQSGKIKIVGDTINADSYGIAVQKGNKALLNAINAGLKDVKDNGTYDNIVNQWFSDTSSLAEGSAN
ncbi:MAG: basic amino acid ABC transporter substrate-binding protein [Eubacteriales bacterium]|nr:basic amino acid ABC transporter substrate-binding protein [Eubacteriales bacterium]